VCAEAGEDTANASKTMLANRSARVFPARDTTLLALNDRLHEIRRGFASLTYCLGCTQGYWPDLWMLIDYGSLAGEWSSVLKNIIVVLFPVLPALLRQGSQCSPEHCTVVSSCCSRMPAGTNMALYSFLVFV